MPENSFFMSIDNRVWSERFKWFLSATVVGFKMRFWSQFVKMFHPCCFHGRKLKFHFENGPIEIETQKHLVLLISMSF